MMTSALHSHFSENLYKASHADCKTCSSGESSIKTTVCGFLDTSSRGSNYEGKRKHKYARADQYIHNVKFMMFKLKKLANVIVIFIHASCL